MCEVSLQLEERVKERRRVRRNGWLFTQMELSGLLAICIVLLSVFMVQPSSHHTLMADLPLTRHAVPMPNARREDAINVTITQDGKVYFRNYRTMCDDLPRAIQEAVRGGGEAKVYVAVDARARYSDVEVVIDAIRRAGIVNVVFLTGTPSAGFGERNQASALFQRSLPNPL